MKSPAEKKKILVFIDWFLPGDKAGGPVRSCANLIDHLGSEFDFSVITRDTDYTETIPYASVKAGQWNNTIPGARVYYIPSDRLNRGEIAHLLTETEYDHVYLNGIWSQPFTIWPLEFLKKNKPEVKVTLAVRGMLAPSALAIKPIRKKVFLAYAKLKGIFSAVTFHATTANEANETRVVFGSKAKVLVAGNLPRKNEEAPVAGDGGLKSKQEGEISLICIARIAPEKNMLFSLEALEHVKSKAVMHFWGPTYDKNYYDAACTWHQNFRPMYQRNFTGRLLPGIYPKCSGAMTCCFIQRSEKILDTLSWSRCRPERLF